MLRIVVCVKAVPDPKEVVNIKLDPVTRTLPRCDVPLVVNRVDRNALEAAVRLKEDLGAHVTVISMGPPPATTIVRECLALGADEGILLCDQAFAGADAFATAYTLAKGIEKLGRFDLVLCGLASSDSGTEWVGPKVGVLLGTPVVTAVEEIVARDGESWTVKASLQNGYRLVRVRLPAVLTVSRGLNTPRPLSFSGIVKARDREITRWSVEDLDVLDESVGLRGSPTITADLTIMNSKGSRRAVKMITGAREEVAERLVEKLTATGIL